MYMRKSVIDTPPIPVGVQEGQWLNLEEIASVQVTSEAADDPIESALGAGKTGGWRAGKAGEQVIRILFDHPVSLRRIHIQFLEREQTRTQEFVLRCVGSDGASREIVRQQWNFSPSGSTSEEEDYRIEIQNVSSLELTIKPDINGGPAVASLASLRLA
jgi:hypothetical protein